MRATHLHTRAAELIKRNMKTTDTAWSARVHLHRTFRLELDGIKVVGKDVPKPVQKWSQCALSRKMLDIVEQLGFDKPTPIQMQAFPFGKFWLRVAQASHSLESRT